MGKTIIIHQATYGEVNKGHDLIQTSFRDTQIAKTIKSLTDLFPKAPLNLGTLPSYLSGFSSKGYYIFMKTFLDESASRSSMVFTHTLWIKQEDVAFINDLKQVLALLPAAIDKTQQLTALALSDTPLIDPKMVTGSQRKIIANLLNDKPSIWIGVPTFETVLCDLWNGLPDFGRQELRFRLSFSPEDLDFLTPNIVYTPPSTINKWERYSKVDATTVFESQLLSEGYLLHDMVLAKPLFELEKALDNRPTTFEALRLLEQIRLLLAQSPQGFNAILRLVRLLGSYAPTSESPIKQKWVKELSRCIPNLSVADFSKLRNLEVNTLATAADTLIVSCQKWLNQSILNIETRYVALFITKGKAWIKELTIKSIQSKINDWRVSYASSLWNWLTATTGLIASLEIPNIPAIETGLVNIYPPTFSKSLAQALYSVAVRHQWKSLHAIVIPKLYAPSKAISLQLAFDKSTKTDSLSLLAQQLPTHETLDYTLAHATQRLILIAGKQCAVHPTLLSGFDVHHDTWLAIWMASFSHTTDIWKGIAQPQAVVFALLDKLLQNKWSNQQAENLFQPIATSDYNNLLTYPNRKKVWQYLPKATQHSFLEATTWAWLKTYEEDNTETVGQEIHSTVVRIFRDIVNSSLSVKIIIQLFAVNSGLQEGHLVAVINSRHQEVQDAALARELGRLVNRKRWQRVFDRLESLKYRNGILRLAIIECRDLRYSWLYRFMGLFRSSKNPSKEDLKEGIYRFLKYGNIDKALQIIEKWNSIENLGKEDIINVFFMRWDSLQKEYQNDVINYKEYQNDVINYKEYKRDVNKLVKDIGGSVARW